MLGERRGLIPELLTDQAVEEFHRLERGGLAVLGGNRDLVLGDAQGSGVNGADPVGIARKVCDHAA